MEAILIKNGRKLKGKLAEIMITKGLACQVDEEIQEPKQIILYQKASDVSKVVKKGGRPKGTTKKRK